MTRALVSIAALFLLAGSVAPVAAQTSQQQEIDALKKILEQQERSIQELKARIKHLESGAAAAPATAAPAPSPAVAEPGEPISPAEEMEAKLRAEGAFGRPSPVPHRGSLDDRQTAAPRPGDYTFEPEYRGFIPIPNTVFLVKFNPKPRLDLTIDSQNSGDDFRFVPALLPLQGTAGYGGGEQANMNSNGSQIRLDLRAPSLPGNFRVYYQNDFFGSDTKNMQYRLQHFYAQSHGIVVGFTYGVFEDPDAWPDTVDYEGPNAVVFARRPLVHTPPRCPTSGTSPSGSRRRTSPSTARPRTTPDRPRARPTAASTCAGSAPVWDTCSSARSCARSARAIRPVATRPSSAGASISPVSST